MELQAGLPKLGKTMFSVQLDTPTSPDPNSGTGSEGTHVQTEGARGTFRAIERVPDNNGTRKTIAGREIQGIMVRNTSGGTLLPGVMVDWEAGYRGRRVDAVTPANAVGDDNAGIVDPYVTGAGVRDGDIFWLMREGATYVRADAAAYTPADVLQISVATDGYSQVKAGAYAPGDDVGFALETKTTTAGDPYLLTDLKMNFH